MTRDDIIRMAQEACETTNWKPGLGNEHVVEFMERFARLVYEAKDAEHQQTLAHQQRSYEREIQLEVEAEREECAQIADAEASIEGIAQRIAAAIRARGNK
jgi:hypothetical protein